MSENITTVEEFIKWVHSLSGSSRIYRGLSDEGWGVKASASRRIEDSSNPEIFKKYVLALLEDAQRNGLGHRAGAELYHLELLADLQHNGAATCLIDFTQSPLTALWFACNDKPERYGRVIGMKTDNTNLFRIVDFKKQREEIDFFFKVEHLWKWQPRYINNRIIAQQSIFVFGKPTIEKSYYDSVMINQESKKTLIKTLEKKYNISEVSLFPDLSGFSMAHAHDKSYPVYSAKEDYFLLGENAYQNQKYKYAVEYYSKFIELNQNHTEAYINRGMAKFSLRKYKDAIEDYNKAIEINPNHAKAYNNRGNAKFGLLKYKGAIEDYNKTIEIDPNYTAAYYNRGLAKSGLGDHKGAIEDYNKFIEINPDDDDAYNSRGYAKYKLGDHNGAIEDYNKAIKINSSHDRAYFNRFDAKTKAAELMNNSPDNASKT